MCLPFLSGGHEDHTRQHHQPSDHHGDAGGYQPYDPIAVVAPSPLKGADHGYVVGKNGGAAGGNAVAQGRRAANKNGEAGAAATYISDSDVPGLRGRKGAAEKLIVASSPARQAHGQMEPKVMAPTTTTTPQAPEQRKEHVAPVQQVARRDDEDSSPSPAAPAPATTAAAERASRDSTSSVNRWK